MLDLDDAKTLISAYKFIERTCNAIDEFIYKHAINFGPDPDETSTYTVINHIVNLMERKNKLIHLKDIVDEVISSLDLMDRQILIIKMRYRTSIKALQDILKLPSERTTFRRIDHAYSSFVLHLNNVKNVKLVKDVIESEPWICKIKQSVVLASASV